MTSEKNENIPQEEKIEIEESIKSFVSDQNNQSSQNAGEQVIKEKPENSPGQSFCLSCPMRSKKYFNVLLNLICEYVNKTQHLTF